MCGQGRERLLETLQRLLTLDATDVVGALNQASQQLVETLGADKVDAFLYEQDSATLVAVGTSDTPMGRRQHQIGMHRQPVANGGTAVAVFQTGRPYHTGQADDDPLMLPGITQGLGVRSAITVPLQVGGQRRGALEAVSARTEAFSTADLQFLEATSAWVGLVVQRAELVEQIARDAAERERRRLAEELISVLAHDLRTPLTVMRGYVQLLLRSAERQGQQADLQNAQRADAASQRLQDMIADLLDTSRLEQGMFAVSPVPVDLSALVGETAELVRGAGGAVDLTAPDGLVLPADPERLRQILLNLLSNAQQHSPPGCPVHVVVATEGEEAVVVVADKGPGISPALAPTLFERFARGERSTGLGLGLYLARGLAQAHGGTLTVSSTPGQGATFRLALPLAGQPVPPPQR